MSTRRTGRPSSRGPTMYVVTTCNIQVYVLYSHKKFLTLIWMWSILSFKYSKSLLHYYLFSQILNFLSYSWIEKPQKTQCRIFVYFSLANINKLRGIWFFVECFLSWIVHYLRVNSKYLLKYLWGYFDDLILKLDGTNSDESDRDLNLGSPESLVMKML